MCFRGFPRLVWIALVAYPSNVVDGKTDELDLADEEDGGK
jgi:hypothetical protein